MANVYARKAADAGQVPFYQARELADADSKTKLILKHGELPCSSSAARPKRRRPIARPRPGSSAQ